MNKAKQKEIALGVIEEGTPQNMGEELDEQMNENEQVENFKLL